MEEQTLGYYMNLPYPIRFVELDDGGFMAMHPSLKGCQVMGNTITYCLKELKKARRNWLSNALELDTRIPIPDDFPYTNMRFVHVYSEAGRMLYSIHVFLTPTGKKKNKRKKVFDYN